MSPAHLDVLIVQCLYRSPRRIQTAAGSTSARSTSTETVAPPSAAQVRRSARDRAPHFWAHLCCAHCTGPLPMLCHGCRHHLGTRFRQITGPDVSSSISTATPQWRQLGTNAGSAHARCKVFLHSTNACMETARTPGTICPDGFRPCCSVTVQLAGGAFEGQLTGIIRVPAAAAASRKLLAARTVGGDHFLHLLPAKAAQ